MTSRNVSAAITAARPSVVADGVATGYVLGDLAASRVLVQLDGSAAATIADPTAGTAGVELWGWFTEWRLIAVLNAGTDIPIVGTGQGWAVVLDLGVMPVRLQVAGTPSAGTVTATYTPIEVQS